MTRYFTHYWSIEFCMKYATMGEGKPLDQTPGAKFTERGVLEGNQVYVVSVGNGRLFLIGKMQVGRIVFSNEEASSLVGYDVYPGDEHLIADLATSMHFNNVIPVDVVKHLQFISDDNPSPKFVDDERLDRQTLRTIRELTPESAALLDRFLEDMKQVELHE